MNPAAQGLVEHRVTIDIIGDVSGHHYSSDALSEPWRTMSAVQIMTVLADERGKRFVIA